MRAALSHSLSKVAGQKISLASRPLLKRDTGEGILSAQPRTLSRLALGAWLLLLVLWVLLVLLLRSQDGSREETRCMITRA